MTPIRVRFAHDQHLRGAVCCRRRARRSARACSTHWRSASVSRPDGNVFGTARRQSGRRPAPTANYADHTSNYKQRTRGNYLVVIMRRKMG